MAKKPKLQAPEDKTIGLAMQANAVKVAQQINDPLMLDINRLVAAKQEYEGGPFTVMHTLTSIMSEQQLNALPDPKADTGNNPAKYLVPITRLNSKGKHTEEWKQRDYYEELALNLPGVVEKARMRAMLERANGPDTVNKADIPASIMDWDPDYRAAQAGKLNNEIEAAKRSVSQAFKLFFQLKKFNTELQHVEAMPMWALGQDGMPLNGAAGRIMQVENVKKPIIVRSTIDGRQRKDYSEVSISAFLDYDVEKASETNGGTYQSVIATTARDKPTETSGHISGTGNAQDQSRPQAVKTPDTANARALDLYVYVDEAIKDKDKAAWQSLKKSVNSDDSDTEFMAWRGLLHYAKLLVGSPEDDKRFAKLTADMEAADKLADAA